MKYILAGVVLFVSGCAAIPATVLLAGISATATAGNQGYQAFDEWAYGKKVFACQPARDDGMFFCKYIRETPTDSFKE